MGPKGSIHIYTCGLKAAQINNAHLWIKYSVLLGASCLAM